MAKVALNTMVAAETLEAIRGLATGKSQGQVVDEAIAAWQGGDRHGEVGRWFRETWTRLDEILETVQSVPFEDVSGVVESHRVVNPTTIPGVSVGMPAVRPVRESGCERAARERRERQERARGLDSVDDESIIRDDDFVSG